MKKLLLVSILGSLIITVFAQTNTIPPTPVDSVKPVVYGKVEIVKDSRLDVLAKKQYDFNKPTTSNKTANSATGTILTPTTARGYRLMVLNSDDRTYAMSVRTKLLGSFPDHKVYMSYQAPFIKIKFGNFLSKADADRYKRMIINYKLVTNNVYVVPEIIEIKPTKVETEDN
jgi:hypothetical protein